MGTNFYAKRIPTKERKAKLYTLVYDQMDVVKVVKMIDNGDFYAARNFINEFAESFEEEVERLEERIHLGKRSCGWQFLWHYHGGKYYKDNLESIKEFLSNPDIIIEDEYHETFTLDEFLNNEIGGIIYKTDDLWDLPAYYKHCREMGKNIYETGLDREFISDDGLRWTSDDFS